MTKTRIESEYSENKFMRAFLTLVLIPIGVLFAYTTDSTMRTGAGITCALLISGIIMAIIRIRSDRVKLALLALDSQESIRKYIEAQKGV